MIVHYNLPDLKTLDRWYLIFQILLLASTVLILILLLLSRFSAATGLYFDHSKAETPKNLHDLIAAHESMLPNTPALSNTRSALKNLRESLLFSLNETSQLSGQKEYQDLCNDLKNLCKYISLLATKRDIDNEIKMLDEKLLFLSNKLWLIIAKQVQR